MTTLECILGVLLMDDFFSSPESGLLSGWKQIAAYLGKSVQTVKRYHKRYSMPVRRYPSGRVFALAYEIILFMDLFEKKIKEYRSRQGGE